MADSQIIWMIKDASGDLIPRYAGLFRQWAINRFTDEIPDWKVNGYGQGYRCVKVRVEEIPG